MANVSAFVLAGGRSSRMGADKALLPWDGDSLLVAALRKAASVCESPVIVGGAERYASFGTVVSDRYEGCGPLGGIHAALSATQAEWNLVLAVDVPLVTPEFLRWLVDLAARSAEYAVIPVAESRLQPLCGMYRRELLPAAQSALEAGQYRVDSLFQAVPCRRVAEQEIISAGFAVSQFRNVNTPEEYEAARQSAVAFTTQDTSK